MFKHIERSALDDSPPPPPIPGSIGRVLVEYEPSPRGREALLHALGVARDIGANLTVVAVARKERVRLGCASCRANTAFWNQEMQTLAEEALAEAGGLAGPSSTIEYAVACGSSDREAVVQAATGTGADLIVVPREPAGRFRHLFSASLAEQLRRDGRWPVVTPPDRHTPALLKREAPRTSG